jgi:uncharacterized Zn-binding protein involved in type VI secretion
VGQPAAKQGDRITAMDIHVVMVPSPPGSPVPTPLPGHVFDGFITEGLSRDVFIEGRAAAVVGSVARTNLAQHSPMPPGVSYQTPPSFEGRITTGSTTVFINGKQAARAGDSALTCNDPPLPPPGAGTVVVSGASVLIG